MTDPATKPPSIAWESYRRWFLLGRVFRLAIQSRFLVLSFVGVLSTIGGWWMLAGVFSGSDEVARLAAGYRSCPWKAAAAPRGPLELMQAALDPPETGPGMGRPPRDAFFDPADRLSAPFRQFFDASRTITGAMFLLLCSIWAAVVWGLFGGALARSAVLQLTREEGPPLRSALRFAGRRWVPAATAPLFPVAALVILAVPAVFVGLLMQASLFIGGVLWPFMLLIGLLGAILLAGLAVGWPLMYAAISTEGGDSFDALSRAYSYVYQRPLHYLFYAVSAALLGWLGLQVVELFAAAVEELALWCVSWGSGVDVVKHVREASAGLPNASVGENLFWFWHGVVRLIVIAFAFAFFWAASSAIYLLLRYDADGTDMHDVYVDDPSESFGLPPTTTDGAGVKLVPQSEEFAPPPSAPDGKPPQTE